MGQTARGFPYPEGTDPVSQGAAAIKKLAEALQANVGRMRFGSVVVPVPSPASNFASVKVTFPADSFTAAPRVFVTPQTSGYISGAYQVTATGFTAFHRQFTNTAATTAVTTMWLAVG